VRNGCLLEHELKGRVEDIVIVSSVRIGLIKCRVIVVMNEPDGPAIQLLAHLQEF